MRQRSKTIDDVVVALTDSMLEGYQPSSRQRLAMMAKVLESLRPCIDGGFVKPDTFLWWCNADKCGGIVDEWRDESLRRRHGSCKRCGTRQAKERA